jgi:L-seryl-tRNA(Ser) seleniumtransferase
LQKQLSGAAHLKTTIIPGESLVGGGSAPTSSLPTFLLAVTADSLSADELATRLRHNNPPIVARVEEGRVLLDLRTVFQNEEQALALALMQVGT